LWHGTPGAIQKKEFFFLALLPDGARVVRQTGLLEFKQDDEKHVVLDPPLFLGFIGTFSIALALNETEQVLHAGYGASTHIRYETLFSAYSRDYVAYKLEGRMKSNNPFGLVDSHTGRFHAGACCFNLNIAVQNSLAHWLLLNSDLRYSTALIGYGSVP
jgi:hypothetical protein